MNCSNKMHCIDGIQSKCRVQIVLTAVQVPTVFTIHWSPFSWMRATLKCICRTICCAKVKHQTHRIIYIRSVVERWREKGKERDTNREFRCACDWVRYLNCFKRLCGAYYRSSMRTASHLYWSFASSQMHLSVHKSLTLFSRFSFCLSLFFTRSCACVFQVCNILTDIISKYN